MRLVKVILDSLKELNNMKECISLVKVEAIQIDGDNIQDIDGVSLSKGWKPTGNFHDRFNEEPEEPTYYVIGQSGEKLFIRNKEDCYLLKYTEPNGEIYFNVVSELFFLKNFKYKN
jgi:hypothetical protein